MTDEANDPTTPAVPTPDYSHQDVLDGREGILPGARVYDERDDNPSEAVVLRVMRQSVNEVFLDGVPISALDPNQVYPDEDPAVVVAYRSDLDAHLPGWRGYDRAILRNHVFDNGDIQTYTFPESRLTTEEP